MKNGRAHTRNGTKAAELRRIRLEMKALQLEIKKAEKEAQIRLDRQFDRIRDRKDELAVRLKELRRAGEHAWDDLKRGFEVSWKDLRKSVHQATARF